MPLALISWRLQAESPEFFEQMFLEFLVIDQDAVCICCKTYVKWLDVVLCDICNVF